MVVGSVFLFLFLFPLVGCFVRGRLVGRWVGGFFLKKFGTQTRMIDRGHGAFVLSHVESKYVVRESKVKSRSPFTFTFTLSETASLANGAKLRLKPPQNRK